MQPEILKQRGKALDEMQTRATALLAAGKAVPDEWRTKMRALAESTDPTEVAEISDWMTIELPPMEYMTDEITWGTFRHFANELLDRLTIFASRKLILDGTPDAEARDIMTEILAIRRATESPIIAMNELAKSRARANRLMDAGVENESR